MRSPTATVVRAAVLAIVMSTSASIFTSSQRRRNEARAVAVSELPAWRRVHETDRPIGTSSIENAAYTSPERNTVGWPRSAGRGETRLDPPTGIATSPRVRLE